MLLLFAAARHKCGISCLINTLQMGPNKTHYRIFRIGSGSVFWTSQRNQSAHIIRVHADVQCHGKFQSMQNMLRWFMWSEYIDVDLMLIFRIADESAECLGYVQFGLWSQVLPWLLGPIFNHKNRRSWSHTVNFVPWTEMWFSRWWRTYFASCKQPRNYRKVSTLYDERFRSGIRLISFLKIHKTSENPGFPYSQHNKDLRWCPSVGCSFAAKKKRAIKRPCRCECGFEFCFDCTAEYWHEPVTCIQLKQWKNSSDTETYKWIVEHAKPCPNCDSNIEKNGGCNHMVNAGLS